MVLRENGCYSSLYLGATTVGRRGRDVFMSATSHVLVTA